MDLFSGPGRVRIRETGEVYDGSPFVALDHDAVPFTHVVLCDVVPENAAGLRHRTRQYGARVTVVEGDANQQIDRLIDALPPHGLNFALVDPFGLEALRFETLVKLSTVRRLDILLNFPTSDVRRNLRIYRREDNDVLDRALGTHEWRDLVKSPRDVATSISQLLVQQLERHGYTGTLNRTVPVRNSKEGELYRLVFLAKHERGDKIWKSITKNTPGGQKGFDFD